MVEETFGRGRDAAAGDEAAAEVPRPRPTEKYWTDYEDWKVRRPPRARAEPRDAAGSAPSRQGKKTRAFASSRGGGPPPSPRSHSSRFAESDPPFSPQTHHPSAIECFERFRAAASGKLLTVFLDYDGTISPIVNKPDEAFMSDEMRRPGISSSIPPPSSADAPARKCTISWASPSCTTPLARSRHRARPPPRAAARPPARAVGAPR